MAGNRSLGSLTVDLILKLGGWTNGWTKAEREAQTRSKNIQRSMTGLKNAITGAFAILGAGALVRGIVRATSEAEKSFALLSNAVEASGGAAGYSATQLSAMAEELQKVSTYSDEAIQDAEGLLLRFQSIQGVNFDRALQSTLDLATALGKDLSSSAILVGKALEDPVKGMGALAKAGVVLSDEQQKLIKSLAETGKQSEAQALLLTELEQRYKGAAAAARNNFGGALEGLKNDIDNLLEAKSGLPGMTESINDLSELIQDPGFKSGFDSFVSGILKVVGAVAGGAAELANFSKWVGETFAALGGVADGDLVRMSDEIIALRDNIKRLQDLGGFGTILQGGAENVALLIDTDIKKLAELEAAYKSARAAAEQALLAKPQETTGGHGGSTSAAAQEAEEVKALAKTYEEVAESIGIVLTVQEERAIAVGEMWRDIRLAVEEGLQEMPNEDDINAMLQEATGEVLDGNTEKLKDAVTEQNEFMLEASRNTQDILAEGFYDAMNGSFDNILDSFIDMLTRMVAESLAADLAGKLFGDAGVGGGGGWLGAGMDWLGGLFGRAGGGPVNAGHMYRVNEAGAEMLSTSKGDYLMMGRDSGNITPAYQLGGGGGVNQVINVTGHLTERTARQLANESSRAQRAAMRLT